MRWRSATPPQAKHKQHFANYCMSVLRSVLNWAKTYDYIETNPLAGLHRLKLKTSARDAEGKPAVGAV